MRCRGKEDGRLPGLRRPLAQARGGRRAAARGSGGSQARGGNWSFAASGGGWEGEARAAAATERQNGCCTRGSEVRSPRAWEGAGKGRALREGAARRGNKAAILGPGSGGAGRKAAGGHLRAGRRLRGRAGPWRWKQGTLLNKCFCSPSSETSGLHFKLASGLGATRKLESRFHAAA